MASDCVAAGAGAIAQKSPAGRGGGAPHLEPPLVERFAPGGSERYPLGERPHAAVASGGAQAGPQDRGQVNGYHTTERFSCQRFPDRYTPVQNLGSLDRYHTYTTLDRYCRTATPTDIRYHTLSTDKHSTGGRYTPVEKYQGGTTERHRHHHSHHQSAQNVCFAASESRRRSGSKQDVYKVRERSSSSDRKDRQDREERQATGYHRMEQYIADRFPTIPCPERFATKEKPDHLFSVAPASSTPSSYLEPPSPAPVSASERRFAPPLQPLSPGHAHEDSTPSPDCFANNAFPSPTAQGGLVPTSTERFAPPPPLSPSPTEQQQQHQQQQQLRYATAVSPKKLERYEKRYHHHQSQQQQQASSAATTAASAAAVAATSTADRFPHKERYQSYSERYPSVSYTTDKFVHNDNRYNSNSNNSGGERYIPPNAHTPVERYVPQPQEPYYGSSYQGYGFKYNSSDPYMRRDLAYHYRLSLPYNGSHYQRVRYMGTPNRMKCCQLQDYQLSKSSPGSSSSSSSVTSSQGKDIHQSKDICIQDIQCQNYPSYQQQEKAVQCGNIATQPQSQCMGYASPTLRTGNAAKGPQCRHSICSSPSVEYVGASGGRHVCATPPPRGSVGSDGGLCPLDPCCAARRQSAITVAVW
nr:unnamed protein product [Callosobruchus chinensis]